MTSDDTVRFKARIVGDGTVTVTSIEPPLPEPQATFEISPTGQVRMLKESGKVNKAAVARTRKFMGKGDANE